MADSADSVKLTPVPPGDLSRITSPGGAAASADAHHAGGRPMTGSADYVNYVVTIPFALHGDKYGEAHLRMPMTPAAWDHLLAILAAHKPGIVARPRQAWELELDG